MSCPLLPAWITSIVRTVADGLVRARVRLGWDDERSAHHGESIAYYEQREREAAHG